MGASVKYTIINKQGDISEHILGPDRVSGQTPQLIVHGGDWKASELIQDNNDFTLLSEVVLPGFEYAENELARFETISNLFPTLLTRLT